MLEVNKNDRSADLSKLRKPKSTLIRGVSGLLLTLMLFSGIGSLPVHAASNTDSSAITQMLNDVDDSTVVDIPNDYQYDICRAFNKEKGDDITVGELRKFNPTFFTIHENEKNDLSWINYCDNLDNLFLITYTDSLSQVKKIHSLPSLKNFSLSSYGEESVEFNRETFGFLKDCPNLEGITLFNSSIEPGMLEELTQVKKMSLSPEENFNVNFSKLAFLDELNFGYTDNPYTLAINFTTSDIETLEKAGVKINFKDPEQFETLKKIDLELDRIVSSLDVTKESSEQEKLDAILIYVLDRLEYDEQVREALNNNQEHVELTQSFYEGGFLFGALEKDSAICGNYTALVQALAHRLDLSSFYLMSDTHAWNLVEVDGEYYYVDATWLDGSSNYKQTWVDSSTFTIEAISAQDAIRNHDTEDLSWYMENPESYPQSSSSESHDVLNFPSFIPITPQESLESKQNVIQFVNTDEEENIDEEKDDVDNHESDFSNDDESSDNITEVTSNDKFEVSFKGKKWIIGGAAAIGILGALGGAVAVGIKKKKDAERRRMMYLRNSNPFSNGYGSGLDSVYPSSWDDDWNSSSRYGRKR